MSNFAELHYEGKSYELPIVEGSEGEKAIDISKLRNNSGLITIDKGYKNTGSTESAITFLDCEKGILRYRGYSIEEFGVYMEGKKDNILILFDNFVDIDIPGLLEKRLWFIYFG